jgi:hypothetical protein
LTSQTLYYYKSDREKKPQGYIDPLKEYMVVSQAENEESRPGQYVFQLKPKPNSANVANKER